MPYVINKSAKRIKPRNIKSRGNKTQQKDGGLWYNR